MSRPQWWIRAPTQASTRPNLEPKSHALEDANHARQSQYVPNALIAITSLLLSAKSATLLA